MLPQDSKGFFGHLQTDQAEMVCHEVPFDDQKDSHFQHFPNAATLLSGNSSQKS